MQLEVKVDEADVGQVREGQKASFEVDAFPGREFEARVQRVDVGANATGSSSASSSSASSTSSGQVVSYTAVLTVANPELILRPGMTATADIVTGERNNVLLVPNAALRFAPPQVAEKSGGGGSGLIGLIMPRRPAGTAAKDPVAHSLWVLRDGVPVEVAVKTGESDGRNTVLLSGEVAEGDAVITDQTGSP